MKIVKQIQCPPSQGKQNLKTFKKKWLKSFRKYGLNYTGIGPMLNLTKVKGKQRKNLTLGENKFIPTNELCDSTSDAICKGQPKYLYFQGYPTGSTTTCIDGQKKNNKIPGNKMLLANIIEDTSRFDFGNHVSAIFGRGKYASKKCVKARLPVGSFLEKKSTCKTINSSSNSLNSTKNCTWWVEERCIPKEKTFKKKYGSEVFNIPYGYDVECFENPKYSLKIPNKSPCKYFSLSLLFFLIVLLIFAIFSIFYVRS